MSDLWIRSYSLDTARWQDSAVWTRYFGEAERILGARLTKLDVNDPLRRKVTSLAEAGEYVCAFGKKDSYRWLFGQFREAKVDLQIVHHVRQGESDNTLTLYTQPSFFARPRWRNEAKALFALGNRTFNAYHGFSDIVEEIRKKKKSRAIDPQRELGGVFWMTYFNAVYVSFFGKDKFSGLPGVEYDEAGGITITLGERPDLLSTDARRKAEVLLGRHSFADPADTSLKPIGRYVLTFERLLTNR